MGELTERVLIGAPPGVVFDLVDDPARYREWQSNLVSVVGRSGRVDGIGSSYEAVYGVFGRRLLTQWVITAADRSRVLEETGTTTGGWAHWRFVLEPDAGDTTRLTSSVDFRLPGPVFAGPISAIAHLVLQRRHRRTIANLRALAEAEAARSTSAAGSPDATAAEAEPGEPGLAVPATADDSTSVAIPVVEGNSGTAPVGRPRGVGPRRTAADAGVPVPFGPGAKRSRDPASRVATGAGAVRDRNPPNPFDRRPSSPIDP